MVVLSFCYFFGELVIWLLFGRLGPVYLGGCFLCPLVVYVLAVVC